MKKLLILLCLLICLVFSAFADKVTLMNGDHITGTIINVSEEKLDLETSYAGKISINITEIDTIETDRSDLSSLEGVTVIVSEPSEKSPHVCVSDEIVSDAEAKQSDEEEEVSHKKWSGSVDAGGTMHSGETDKVNANVGVEVIRKWAKDTLTLSSGAGFSEVDSEVNERYLRGSAKWQHEFSKKRYGFSTASAEHDPGRSLELRLELDVGVGYRLIESEKRSLSLDFGLNYSHEKWNKYSLTELEKVRQETGRSYLDTIELFVSKLDPMPWSFLQLGDNITELKGLLDHDIDQETSKLNRTSVLLGVNYMETLFTNSVLKEELRLLPSVNHFGEYRIVSDLSFESPLSEKISMKVNLETEYVSEAVDSDDQLNNRLILGLRYKF